MEVMDTKQLWESVLVEMELSLTKANFQTWFKDTYIVKHEDGSVFLSVPNNFVKEWLQSKYHNTILKHIRNAANHIHSVEYVVSREGSRHRGEPQRISEPFDAHSRELPLSELSINKEDNLNPRYTFANFVVGPFNELAHAAAQAVMKNLGILYNPLFIY